jgi:integrase/recombinase XerC
MNLATLIHNFSLFLSIQKQRSKHTVSNYARDVAQFFSMLTIDSPTLITEHHIHTYLNAHHKNNMTHRSIHRKMSALDQFWRYLIQENIVENNPWDAIRRPKLNQHLPNYLEEHAMLELLNNYPHSSPIELRNKAILELLFSSGIRVNELIQLRLDDIDLVAQECRVMGKGDKERVVLFGSRAQISIQNYLGNARMQWGPIDNTVFISSRGQAITARTIQRMVKAANRYHSSSVDITPHSCRHTCASMLISNGAGIRDIQELLGHSSIATTERYSHLPTKKLTQHYLDIMNQ